MQPAFDNGKEKSSSDSLPQTAVSSTAVPSESAEDDSTAVVSWWFWSTSYLTPPQENFEFFGGVKKNAILQAIEDINIIVR